MSEYKNINQEIWNTWAGYHVDSKFYDVESFKRGRTALDALELAGVGDVTGKTLLHLQCHFGMSTICWARRGAIATGVDFAPAAITAARALAAEMSVPATFIESNIYDLPDNLSGQFDIVFTSHGVLPWLPDLAGWAKIVAHFLKPGGIFYIVEGHPFATLFDTNKADREFPLIYSYFHDKEPIREEGYGSYAAPDAPIKSVVYEWQYPISDVINALINVGLSIESFNEYPCAGWPIYPWLEERDGLWHIPADRLTLPLSYSIKAVAR